MLKLVYTVRVGQLENAGLQSGIPCLEHEEQPRFGTSDLCFGNSSLTSGTVDSRHQGQYQTAPALQAEGRGQSPAL